MDLETSVIRVLKIIKMANTIDIPSKSYNTYFGDVNQALKKTLIAFLVRFGSNPDFCRSGSELGFGCGPGSSQK